MMRAAVARSSFANAFFLYGHSYLMNIPVHGLYRISRFFASLPDSVLFKIEKWTGVKLKTGLFVDK